eukprot:CAMPEP_0114319410 /NCGR_PEP_ID=MMETSP0059-20121206/25225_1 /TAXON_ID=36894 /ORGANISM="Pyramimonas parkeae, Strain CCMP726" /LENGTH=288 /DNA_ID=CAMNT_0001446413 /DNA_START=57 /DNA_END=924 /DNA_ORIENTATION=+
MALSMIPTTCLHKLHRIVPETSIPLRAQPSSVCRLSMPKTGGVSIGSRRVMRVYAEGEKQEYSNNTKLRSEAQAPFRTFRTFVFGGLAALAALAGCLLILKRDRAASEKQMARISREERLSSLQVELASGRMVRLKQLRGFARPVIVAGSTSAIEQHMAAAEPHKEALLARGVITVAVPLDGGCPVLPELAEGDTKWRAEACRTDKWKQWLSEQMTSAKLAQDSTVYMSLRMDGRVRGSGKGCPPWDRLAVQLPPVSGTWDRLAVQLPPVSGMWSGIGDGFDGIVGDQ